VRVVAEAGTALVSVRDNGMGIQPHRLEEVFEMFSQEEPALSRSKGGLGIGLALTRRLVQMHGGSVTARSEGLGKGSEFLVRIPVLGSQAAGEAQPVPVPAAATATGGLRILVADDNFDAAETLGVLLEVMGHEVRRVHDGEAAVLEAGSFDPHLVLLDIGMPKLNGYETCRRIREQSAGAARTLVAVTGWGQPQDVQQARDAGFDRHMVKPLDIGELVKLIDARATQGGS
jgi:CheY-like chemotaxis protein